MKATATFCGRIFAGRFALLLLLNVPFPGASADWPQYRGANHDGVSTDRLNKTWTGSVTNPVWRVPIPNCLGSLTVSGGRVFTQTRRQIGGSFQEVCLALNAATGAELWASPVDLASYPQGGVGFDDGPRSTPSVDGDSVFVLSSYLKLHRLNATTGATNWQRDLRVDFGGDVIGWQNAASPLLGEGLIFVNANCSRSNLMALRTANGGVAWRSQNEAMTHSTPVLATLHGVRQLIFATQSGLVSLDPASGDSLWKSPYPFVYNTSIGVSPVVYEDMVFVCGAHAYGMGSMVAQVTLSNSIWTATRLWSTNNPASHWMTPVAHQGFLYGQFGIQGFDSPSAQLKCLDMRTGQERWSMAGFGRGGTIMVDEHLVTISEQGNLVLSVPTPTAYTERGRFRAIPFYNGNSNKCWNVPAVDDGRVYIRSTAYAACFDLSVPGLQFEAPALAADGTLAFAVRTTNGAPVNSNRLAGMELRAAASPVLPAVEWTRLTNELVFSNGTVRIDNVDTTAPQRYFLINEPR